MGVDAIVVRHGSAGVPWQIARWVDAVGDQRRRRLARAPHPGAARLLHDPPAPRRRSTGTHIAIVGDIKHSRVARSDVLAFTALGAEVTLVAPPTLLPPSLEGWPVDGEPRPRRGAARRSTSSTCCACSASARPRRWCPSLREYTARYGLTAAPGRPAAPTDALVMHPGPMNRGVEIAAEVADLPTPVIIDQVANGVAVRMAVLFLLLGSGRSSTRARATA